jgi:hypothetical protein
VTQDKEEMLYLVEAVIGERRVQVLSAATWEPLLNIPSDKIKKGELPSGASRSGYV